MSDDYLWDRTGADPEVARLEALLGGHAHDAPLGPLPERRRRRPWLAIGAVVVAAAAIAIAAWATRGGGGAAGCGPAGPGFAFTVTGAPARCGGVATRGGVLPVGVALETPAGATAEVTVADIGALTLAGGSQLTLAATGAEQHRLRLARGRLAARVTAPPRLFVVDTPAATAVDLGCAYELVVLPDGRTRLTVTSGVVELGAHDHLAHVTVGHTVTTVAGRGPGTPVAVTAAPALVELVERYDAGDAAALPALLVAAGPGDTLTVWNLLANAPAAERGSILARLDDLFPRPEWILEGDVVDGQPQAIDGLRDVLTSGVWLAPTPPDPSDVPGGVWK
ncbi:MAG: FecR domain-containing protein [Myxococcales bacterium]|nr:FecR domain-containing protein [Myxococcales bacterium]